MLDSELDTQVYIGPLSCCVPKVPMYLCCVPKAPVYLCVVVVYHQGNLLSQNVICKCAL